MLAIRYGIAVMGKRRAAGNASSAIFLRRVVAPKVDARCAGVRPIVALRQWGHCGPATSFVL